MEEYLDVVDDNNNITGKTEKKSYIHKNGIWHREVACWIMNNEGEILVQKRAKTKEHAPSKWDITAGHVQANEIVENAMIRELQEEIGIKLKKCDLELFSIVKRKGISTRNNTFQYQYFIYTNKKISEFIIDTNEVEEVKYITLGELKEILSSNDENYTFSKRKYMLEIFNKLNQKYWLLQNLK